MHYSRTTQQVPQNRPVSDLIVEAFRNGHPIWQIATRCQVPRSHVETVLKQRGEIMMLPSEEQRVIEHVKPQVKVDAG